MVVTKKQLVKAMFDYNQDTLTNPDDYGEIDSTMECAEIQINNLLKYLK